MIPDLIFNKVYQSMRICTPIDISHPYDRVMGKPPSHEIFHFPFMLGIAGIGVEDGKRTEIDQLL
jgi:hypothetical protein